MFLEIINPAWRASLTTTMPNKLTSTSVHHKLTWQPTENWNIGMRGKGDGRYLIVTTARIRLLLVLYPFVESTAMRSIRSTQWNIIIDLRHFRPATHNLCCSLLSTIQICSWKGAMRMDLRQWFGGSNHPTGYPPVHISTASRWTYCRDESKHIPIALVSRRRLQQHAEREWSQWTPSERRERILSKAEERRENSAFGVW